LVKWIGENFKVKFLAALDKLAPSREFWLKQRSKPWITSEILELIRQKDKYLCKFKKSTVDSEYEMCVSFRNQIRYKKERLKSQPYVNMVNENQRQP